MRRDAGNALARKDKGATAAEKAPLQKDYMRAVQAIRAYLGVAGVTLAAVTGSVFWFAQDHSPKLEPDDPEFLPKVDRVLRAHPPEIPLAFVKTESGGMSFSLGDAELIEDIRTLISNTVFLEASFDFPAAQSGRTRSRNITRIADFETMQKFLETPECHVRVGDHYFDGIPMRLRFDPMQAALWPKDFPRQICDQKVGAAPSPEGKPKPIGRDAAMLIAVDEIEMQILTNDPLVVQVDVESGDDAPIRFSLRRHEALLAHHHVDSVSIFNSPVDNSPAGVIAGFDKNKNPLPGVGSVGIGPASVGWVHDLFQKKSVGARINYAIQGTLGALNTNLVRLDYTPRALAWYEKWKQENPDAQEVMEAFQAEVATLSRSGLVIEVRDDEIDGHTFFSYKVALPDGFPPVKHIKELSFGRQNPSEPDIFRPYGRMVRVEQTLVFDPGQYHQRLSSFDFAEKFWGNSMDVRVFGPNSHEDLPRLKYEIRKKVSAEGEEELQKSMRRIEVQGALTSSLMSSPLKISIGLSPDAQSLHVAPLDLEKNPLLNISGLQSFEIRYGKPIDGISVEYVGMASFFLNNRGGMTLASDVLAPAALPFIGKFEVANIQMIAVLKQPDGSELSVSLANPRLFSVELDDRLKPF